MVGCTGLSKDSTMKRADSFRPEGYHAGERVGLTSVYSLDGLGLGMLIEFLDPTVACLLSSDRTCPVR